MSRTVPTVLTVASAGGHWVQLMRLLPAWDGCRVVHMTTSAALGAEARRLAEARGQTPPDVVIVTEANRWQKLKLLTSLMLKSCRPRS